LMWRLRKYCIFFFYALHVHENKLPRGYFLMCIFKLMANFIKLQFIYYGYFDKIFSHYNC
jgi:hypothetical protein